MTDPPIKPNQEKAVDKERFEPPVNRAQATVRVILWILPSGFALLSIGAGEWLNRSGYAPFQLGVGTWLLVNVAFVIGAGWYNASLSTKARGEADGLSYQTVLFFFLQLFLVPLLFGILLFLACVIDPVDFGGH